MKFSYKLLFFAVFTLLLSVAVSEESIEVTVDNTPKPSPKEIAAMEEIEGLRAELKRVEQKSMKKQAEFETEMTNKMNEIEKLKEQLKKKQEAYAELEIVVSQQEERLKLLVSNNNKLQAHVDKLNAPLTFIDFIVDVFEHQILPACDTAIEKATPYVKMAVVDFWNTNSVCLVVREKAIECYVKSTTFIGTFWRETVVPTVNPYLEPYYPTLTEYYELTCSAVKTAWEKTCEYVCEGSHFVFTWAVDKYEILHREMSKVCGEYTPFLHYLVLVCVLHCICKLLCFCCPCKWCCCGKKCCGKKCCGEKCCTKNC